MLRGIKTASNNKKILDKEKFIEYAVNNKDKYFLIKFGEDYLINPWNLQKLYSDFIVDNPVKVTEAKVVKKRRTPPQQPS